MRLAAIYNIHGNLPALEAVLREIRELKVDQVVVGGDIVPGPMPRETLSCLLDIDAAVKFIYGNGEVAVLEEMAGRKPSVPPQYLPIISWTAQQLQPEDHKLLAAWSNRVTVQIHGLGHVLFCHAPPRNENEIFTRLTPENRLLPVFAGVNAQNSVTPSSAWFSLADKAR